MFKNKLMKYRYPLQLGLKIRCLRSSTDRVRPPKAGYPGSNPGGGFTLRSLFHSPIFNSVCSIAPDLNFNRYGLFAPDFTDKNAYTADIIPRPDALSPTPAAPDARLHLIVAPAQRCFLSRL